MSDLTFKVHDFESDIGRSKFKYVDTAWDIEHAAELELKDGITKLPKVDYRRQPPNLLPVAAKVFGALLGCEFYDSCGLPVNKWGVVFCPKWR